MSETTLGSVFTKHLGFPRAGKGRVGADEFAARLEQRAHGLGQDTRDPMSWIEHFFDLEHAFEARSNEFLGAFDGREDREPVVEFDLGEQEYVVIEDGEEVVVVSDGGSMVLQRTAELMTRLKAAELPAAKGSSPNAVFKQPGERAYRVSASGAVASLDAKLVAKALQGAAVRTESLARVGHAQSRLAAFQPRVRTEAPATKPVVKSEATRQIAQIARAEKHGGAPRVVVLQKGAVREERGSTARWWQRYTSSITEGGRLTTSVQSGTGAVAVGRQTFVVKAGGVTAVVQRPADGVGRRNQATTRRIELASEQRTERVLPKWLAAEEAPARRRGWLAVGSETRPAVHGSAEKPRPEWLSWVREQAREARAEARREIAHGSAVSKSPIGIHSGVAGSAIAHPVDRRVSLPPLELRESVSHEFVEAGLSGRSMANAASLPAMALQALATSLERVSGADIRSTSSSGARHRFSLTNSGSPISMSASDASALWAGEGFVTGAPGVIRTTQAPSAGAAASAAAASEANGVFSAPFMSVGGLAVGRELSARVDFSPSVALSRAPMSALLPSADPFEAFENEAAPLSPMYPRGVRATLRAGGSVGQAYEVPAVEQATVEGPQFATLDAAPTAMTASAWLEWAVKHSREARAHEAGAPIATWPTQSSRGTAQLTLPGAPDARVSSSRGLGASASGGGESSSRAPSSIGGLFAPAGAATTQRGSDRSYYPSDVHALEARSRFPSLFLRFDAGAGQDGFRAPGEMSFAGPEIGLFATPMTPEGVFPMGGRVPDNQQSVVPTARPTVSQSHSSKAPFVTGTWSPAEGGRAIPVRLSPLFLADVNKRRAPDPVATAPRYSASLSEETDEVVIPVPLWVQMADAAPAAQSLGATGSTPEVTRGTRVALSPELNALAGRPGAQRGYDVDTSGTLATPMPSDAGARGIASQPVGGLPGLSLGRPAPRSAFQATPAGFAAAPRTVGESRSAAPVGTLRGLSQTLHGVSQAAAPGGASAPAAMGLPSPEMATVAASPTGSTPLSSLFGGAPKPVTDAAKASGTDRSYYPSQARAVEQAKASAATPGTRTASSAVSGSSAAPSVSSAPSRSAGTSDRGYYPSEARAQDAARSAPAASQNGAAGAGRDTASYYPSELARASRVGRGGYLRFRFPSSSRWWTPPTSSSESVRGELATLSGGGAADRAFVDAASAPSGSAAPWIAGGVAAAGLGLGAAAFAGGSGKSMMAAPSQLRRSTGAAGAGGVQASSAASTGGMFGKASTPARRDSYYPSDLASGVRESDPAYVVVNSAGETQVINAGSPQAARIASARANGTNVDMTVVTAMQPTPPPLEDTSVPGHLRPHLKGKNEGSTKPAGGEAGKSSSMGLQGTVDSLAQRIYHRLKRRLDADRERFGG